MRHLEAVLIKFLMVAVVLELVLLNMSLLSFWRIMIIAAVVTALSYVLGDFLILRRTTNTTATISDIVLSFLFIYMFNFVFFNYVISFAAALVAAVVIGVGEWFFHKFVERMVFPHDTKRTAQTR